MNFKQSWESTYTKNYANFNGRSPRIEYIHIFISNILIDICYFIIDPYSENIFILLILCSLIIPNIALNIRRLHDVNKSGWFILLPFTIIGAIPFIYWVLIKEGDLGKNNFGENEILKHYSSQNKNQTVNNNYNAKVNSSLESNGEKIEEKLKRLKKMLDEKLITEDDYNAKKKELLKL